MRISIVFSHSSSSSRLNICQDSPFFFLSTAFSLPLIFVKVYSLEIHNFSFHIQKRNTIIMNVTLIVIMWRELNFVSIFPWYVLKGLNFLLMFSFVFLFNYMLFCRSFDYNGFHLVVWGGREEIPFCFWFIGKN